MTPPRPGRGASADLLRVALATLVLFSHSFALTGRGALEPLHRLTGGATTLGQVAVAGFFLLSGYLVAGSWRRCGGLGRYLLRRARRIVPGFWAAALGALFVVAPLGAERPWSVHDNHPLWKALPEALLLFSVRGIPSVFAANPVPAEINGSLWTIRWELLCYLGLGVLGTLGGLRRRVATPLAVLVMAAALWQGTPVGVLAAAFAVGAAASTWWPVPAPPPGRGIGGWDLSYGIYLWAWPVQQLLVRGLGAGIGPYGLFAAALGPTLLLAALSWRGVEAPFLRRGG